MTNKPHMTLPNGDIIREGDYAITRDGQKVGPMIFGHDGTYAKTHPWRDNASGLTFTCNGSWDEKSKPFIHDLIAKWHDVAPGPDPVRPDYNKGEWHTWNGGDCPVHPKSVVEVRLRSGFQPRTRYSGECAWWHDQDSSDITSFRVVTQYVEPAPEPVTPPDDRDLRTIDEPFYLLDEKTQARLRKADSKGWPLQTRGLTSDGTTGSEWNAISKSGWYREETIRLDPTFTPPAKRRKWWIVENRVFDSARQAKIAFPGSAPIKVKECKK